MLFRKPFPFFRQREAMDCGPACLRMIAKFHGRLFSLSWLRQKSAATREGVSLKDLAETAATMGLKTRCVLASAGFLTGEARLPCIVHWEGNHFVVVYGRKKGRFFIADPAFGKQSVDEKIFMERWARGRREGYALLMEPTERFYANADCLEPRRPVSFLLSYIRPRLRLLSQIFLAMILGSAIQLTLPFLTRMIVDRGVYGANIGLLKLILAGQFALILGRTCSYFLRDLVLFHISTPVNISLVYDFLTKLCRLPLGYFDTRRIGDTLQRLADHQRVESFITRSVLGLVFAIMNMAVFGVVLALYSLRIFFVFTAGTILYFLWIRLFLPRRREIDFRKFRQMGKSHSTVIQMITGMQEIRLNTCENRRIREWINVRKELYNTELDGLSLTRKQQFGCSMVQETQNILITFIAALSVIGGAMTLGTMLAIQFILGQLRGPVDQFLRFAAEAQDAAASFERIEEVHSLSDEENEDPARCADIPDAADITIRELSFRYTGASENALRCVSAVFPAGKTTAVVGSSGSGNTTLLKLLLGIYTPQEGGISIGGEPLAELSLRAWRRRCGSVMQEGYVFSDTVRGNIAISDDLSDEDRVRTAARAACIEDFILSLPGGYEAMIGPDGHGLSQGQRQRILIARALCKNPRYLFLDEPTNSLDAGNESTIMQNLAKFFHGRTVILAAHRLSTVKNADLIVVLEKGSIVETGSHRELLSAGGVYSRLVAKQIEQEAKR